MFIDERCRACVESHEYENNFPDFFLSAIVIELYVHHEKLYYRAESGAMSLFFSPLALKLYPSGVLARSVEEFSKNEMENPHLEYHRGPMILVV